MNNGLNIRDIQTIKNILGHYPKIRLVYLFGSRAKGTFRPGSDVDLAIINNGVDDALLRQLKGEFEESSLPYLIDIMKYENIDNPALKKHIDRVGIEFYKKE